MSPAIGPSLLNHGQQVFGADLRGLAAFRIALGVTIAYYVFDLMLDADLLLTGSGVAPARAVWPVGSVPILGWPWVQALIDSRAFVMLLLISLGGAAIQLALGVFTRASTFYLWLAMSFLVRRNPWIGNAADDVVLFCLLFGLFLPLSAWGSVDRRLGRAPVGLPVHVFSAATFALVLQILFVYLSAAMAKSGPEWHAEASALGSIARVERFQTLLTPWLAGLPEGVKQALTRAVWHLEALAPLLLLSPVFFGPVRTATTLALMSMHLGIALTMDLGIFPWICISYLFVLLPTAFWDRVTARPEDEKPPDRDALPAGRGPSRWRSYATPAFMGVLVACVLLSYARYVPALRGRAPRPVRWVASKIAGNLRIGVAYGMFSVVKSATDRYQVIGRDRDGAILDVLAGGPGRVEWDAAQLGLAPDASEGFFWELYTKRARSGRFSNSLQALYYADYWCRRGTVDGHGLAELRVLHHLKGTEDPRAGVFLAYDHDCASPVP